MKTNERKRAATCGFAAHVDGTRNNQRVALLCLLLYALGWTVGAGEPPASGGRQSLAGGWRLQSSVLVPDDGKMISSAGYAPREWFPTTVPSTVLSALVKNGIYPDPRVGMNSYRIPDSSFEFNQNHDLAQFSHLPDKRNPWRDPWWFRREFTLPKLSADRQAWLHFNCINYRAEVWLNGMQIADTNTMVGMFQRFDFDITAAAKAGANALAVKILPVDHPGVPETQTETLGRDRGYQKDLMKDVTMVTTVGYDCAPTVPDRNMGIIQNVWVDESGPVVIRHPFVATELPLPETNRCALRISGDGMNFLRYWYRRLFNEPSHGRAPMGWQIGAAATDLMPDILDYYYRHASANECFVNALTGVGYIWEDNFAEYLPADRQPQVWDDYVRYSSEYRARLDATVMSTIFEMSPDKLARFAGMPGMKGIFANYGRMAGTTLDNEVFVSAGRPVFRAVNASPPGDVATPEGCRTAADFMIMDIREWTPRNRPGFLHVFLGNWLKSLDVLERVVKGLGSEYVCVRPDQLPGLYGKAQP